MPVFTIKPLNINYCYNTFLIKWKQTTHQLKKVKFICGMNKVKWNKWIHGWLQLLFVCGLCPRSGPLPQQHKLRNSLIELLCLIALPWFDLWKREKSQPLTINFTLLSFIDEQEGLICLLESKFIIDEPKARGQSNQINPINSFLCWLH